MQTCSTCAHWQPYPFSGPHQATGGGLCHSDKITENVAGEAYRPDALVYPYHEGAGAFWTGPQFGCVHHTPKG